MQLLQPSGHASRMSRFHCESNRHETEIPGNRTGKVMMLHVDGRLLLCGFDGMHIFHSAALRLAWLWLVALVGSLTSYKNALRTIF